MAGLSDYAEAIILNCLLRGQTYSGVPNTSLYLALFTQDPNDIGTSYEASGGWYARKTTGAWAQPAVAGNGYSTNNSTAITFNAVTGSTVTISHIGIFDAATGGNLLFSAPMTSTKTLQVGDVLSFAGSTINITLD